MTFKRMHRARIHLLHDLFLPDDLNDAVLFAAERLTKADASPVASLWDITAALHLAHRPEKSDDFVDPPKQVQSTDPAVCTAPVTQVSGCHPGTELETGPELGRHPGTAIVT